MQTQYLISLATEDAVLIDLTKGTTEIVTSMGNAEYGNADKVFSITGYIGNSIYTAADVTADC